MKTLSKNIKHTILAGICMLLSLPSLAADWDFPTGKIQTLYIYPTYVVVVMGGTYTSKIGCTNEPVFSFRWSDFDPATASRIYAALLAAKQSGSSFKPIIHDGSCGPEGKPRLIGDFVLP